MIFAKQLPFVKKKTKTKCPRGDKFIHMIFAKHLAAKILVNSFLIPKIIKPTHVKNNSNVRFLILHGHLGFFPGPP